MSRPCIRARADGILAFILGIPSPIKTATYCSFCEKKQGCGYYWDLWKSFRELKTEIEEEGKR